MPTLTPTDLSQRRVATLYENGRVELIEEPTPALQPGQVLVRITASIISPGTHLNRARTNRKAGRKDPGERRPFGYQGAGEVAAVGEGVTRFAVGDRVACMGPGALHTDLALVPVNLVVPLPDGVSDEQGAYCHLAATALQAIRRGKPEIGEFIFIAGMGIVGQVAAQLARLSGMYVMASDAVGPRLEKAKTLGAHPTCQVGADDAQEAAKQFTDNAGFDMALIAFGGEVPNMLTQMHDLMRLTPDDHREGRIVIVGGLTATTTWASGMSNVDVRSSARTGPGYHDDDWEHGRTAYPYPWVRWGTQQNLALVLRLMAEGQLHVDELTTHRLPLDRIGEAVEDLLERPGEALGCVVTS